MSRIIVRSETFQTTLVEERARERTLDIFFRSIGENPWLAESAKDASLLFLWLLYGGRAPAVFQLLSLPDRKVAHTPQCLRVIFIQRTRI